MALARTNSKIGVPVDLRYQFDGESVAGQPVTLHLAAVPRTAVSNLSVSIKPVAGISTDADALRAEKATVGTAYRQQLSVTRQAQGPTELRVLVTTDMPQGRAFSYFSVPLASAAVANKQAPVEMR